MSVFIYQGGLRLVRKSGVGQAILHQKQALERAGVAFQDKGGSKVSVIHLNTIFPDSLFMVLIARIRRWRVIWYAHSTMEDFRASFPFSDLLAPLFRRYITLCYNRADAVITPTEYSKNLIQGYGVKKPIYVVSNGVDALHFRKDVEKAAAFRKRYGIENEKTVITVALPIERKGILDFIALAEEMSDVRFIWFGSLSVMLIPRKIRKAISKAPGNVLFAGFVDQVQLIEAYSGADCFLFMSHEETEGIAVLEALSCGTPAVLRALPVYSAFSEKGMDGCLFSSLSECRKALRKVLYGDTEDISRAERQIAEGRDIGRIGEKLKEIYRDLSLTEV